MAGLKRESPPHAAAVAEPKKPRLSAHGAKAEPATFADDLQHMAPIATKASAWPRKPLVPVDPRVDSVAFQWIDIDMYDGLPLRANPKAGAEVPGLKASGDASQTAAIIRLYGVTAQGHSVLLHVHGVLPYFYCACPDDFDESRCGEVRAALDAAVSQRDRDSSSGARVVGVQVVRDKMSIYGYQFDRYTTLFKVFLSQPGYVPKLRSALEGGLTLPGCEYRNYQTYESNVPFLLRFMIDEDIRGCNWVEAPKGAYSVRSAAQKKSLCQLEIDITYDNLVSHAPEGEWGRVAPLRILSFDIECMGRKGHFPEADQDPVIQIANVVQEQGSHTPIIRNVFVLDTCKPIVGAHVMEFEEEGEMLEKWARFVQEVDPDIITGYNIANFDIPYLLNRGKALRLQNHNLLGRLANTYVYPRFY